MQTFFKSSQENFRKSVINCMRNEKENKNMEKQNFKYKSMVFISKTIYLATDTNGQLYRKTSITKLVQESKANREEVSMMRKTPTTKF